MLDLGSGGGIDVLLSARRVGPTGKAHGLDMTDEMLALARENAAEGRRRERRVPQGLHRGDPAPRRERRRRHLQLRDQPLRRQAQGAARGRARAAARRSLRRLRRDRRRGHGRRDARRHAGIDRLHRRGAHPREFDQRSPMPGLVDVEIRETHRVHAAGRLGDRPRAQADRAAGMSEARTRFTCTIRRRSTATGRRASGVRGTSTCPPTASNGRRWRTARSCRSSSAR